MKTFLVVVGSVGLFGFFVGAVSAQTCAVTASPAPPIPISATVTLSPDGGGSGCSFTAFVPGGAPPHAYQISTAKCITMVNMAQQAAAIDNGWGDGGVP
jgi:hypothetical protein